jgi:hypothetical protein
MNRKKVHAKKVLTKGAPSKSISVLLPIREYYTQSATASSGAGAIAQSIPIRPSSLLLAARLAGYQALRDEIRIDSVRVEWLPLLSASTGTGTVCMYIERDPAAAIVASTTLAMDQLEQSNASGWKPINIRWGPQQPSDFAFNLLNPGTVSLGTVQFVGGGLPATAACGLIRITLSATLRGRP